MERTSTQWEITHVREQVENRILDFSPDYQRNYVWTQKQQVYLIDSILKNFPLPKIFARQSFDENADVTYEIIDGQQRLTTILKFLNNEFPILKKRHPKPDTLGDDLDGMYFKDLPLELKRNFKKYALSVDIITANREETVDMFTRLNLITSTLKDQELLNAQFDGDFKQLVYSISEEYVDSLVENKIVTASSVKRMADARLISFYVITILKRGLLDKAKEFKQFYEAYDVDWEEDDQLKVRREFRKIYNLVIEEIFQNEIKTTSYKAQASFYSVFEYFHYKIFVMNNHLSSENYSAIREQLLWLAENIKQDGTGDGKLWYDVSIQGGETLSSREKRKEILKKYLDPFFDERDRRRSFSESDRITMWNSSHQKICGICEEVISSFDDMDLDHIKPYSIGGQTTLNNARLTHASCNRSRGNRSI